MEIINVAKERLKNKDYYCPHFPVGYVECRYPRDCQRCELGDRIRRSNAVATNNVPLFTYRDARRQTDKGGGAMWWNYPIILSEECMERLGFEKNIFFQIAVADTGSGVFLKNPTGPIDCHLFTNPSRKFTITRNEAYGIPNERAVELYDKLFFYDLGKLINKLSSAKGGWCL